MPTKSEAERLGEARYCCEKSWVENVNVAAQIMETSKFFLSENTEFSGTVFRPLASNDQEELRAVCCGLALGRLMHNAKVSWHSEAKMGRLDSIFWIAAKSVSPTAYFCGTWRRSQGCFNEPDGVIVNRCPVGFGSSRNCMVGCRVWKLLSCPHGSCHCSSGSVPI
jgi:hypothetical protein